MSNDLTLFFRKSIDEGLLLSLLENVTGTPCCSLKYPSESASVFLMSLEYNEGFRHGVSLSWPHNVSWPFNSALTIAELSGKLANALHVEVLFEGDNSISDTNREKWILAIPGESVPRSVSIKELSDGVCLASDA